MTKAKQVACQSGIKGWQSNLQDVYRTYSEFADFCFMYNNHARLGFSTPEEAWEANPVVQGSTNPSDYRRI